MNRLRAEAKLRNLTPDEPRDNLEAKYSEGYDENLSKQLWRLTQIVYCDDDSIKNFDCD